MFCFLAILIKKPFNRGIYLQTGATILNENEFMCFMDVDLLFDDTTLWRFSQNARRKRPYFPIFFTEYSQRKLNPDDDGYWRDTSFGMLCTYKKDFDDVGGFNVSIIDWGKEDIDLYNRFVEADYETVRSIDPKLRHIFHPIRCNIVNLEQRIMCLNVKAETITSSRYLAEEVLKDYRIYGRLIKTKTYFNASTPMT